MAHVDLKGPTSAAEASTTANTPYLEIKAQNLALNRQEIAKGASVLKSRPILFWFDLYGPCNLECAHCGFRKEGRTSDQDVSERVYEAVKSEIMPTAKLCHLGGSNWGEMTISKTFQPFLRDCKQLGVDVNLTTNGTRMDDAWFDDLLDVLSVIGFSMEGMGDEFEKIRGFKWRFFLKHVEKICQGRADRGKTFKLEWRYCAHSESIHQLPDMIRLANSIGVDRIQVMNLIPYLKDQEHKKLFYHRSLANQFFGEARRVAAELNFEISIPPDFSTGQFERELVQLNTGAKTPRIQTTEFQLAKCYMPWQSCSINELGNMKPDAIYWRSAGNLNTGSFESIWNGKLYRRLRSTVNRKPDSICVGCRLPFDSDQNVSALQSQPGIRERIRDALTIHRSKYDFVEINPDDQVH